MKRRMLAATAAILAGSFLFLGLATAPAGAKTKPTDSYLGVYEANVAVTSLSENAVVPTYTCKKGEQIDIYANTYDQDSSNASPFDGAYVDLACSKSNQPEVYPNLEVDGNYVPTDVTISEGDTIQISVTCGPSGSVEKISDLTTGGSTGTSTDTASSCNGVFAGNIGVLNKKGTKVSPLPAFGSISFGSVEVNSSPIGDTSPAPTSVNYYEGKKNQIDVGPLTAGGSAFVNTQES
jgi:hypothetical protein